MIIIIYKNTGLEDEKTKYIITLFGRNGLGSYVSVNG